MPPRLRKRAPTPPVQLPPGRPDEEEVFSVHSVNDSSSEDMPQEVLPQRRASKRIRLTLNNGVASQKTVKARQSKNLPVPTSRPKTDDVQTTALTISDDASSKAAESPSPSSSVVVDEDEGLVLENVEYPPEQEQDSTIEADVDVGEDEDLDLEDVDFTDQSETVNENGEEQADAYAAAYQAADAGTDDGASQNQGPAIYYDGKGQANGISVHIDAPKKALSLSVTKRKGPIITPRDRQVRLATHKLVALSVIAHARSRNALINHDGLRDDLYGLVPNSFLEKLRLIHPRKVPVQTERVRQFESFLRDLTQWWSRKFILDPVMTTCGALRQPDADILAGVFPPVGRRVDGWIVESAREREDRHRAQRKAEQALVKGKAAANASQNGSSIRPKRSRKGKSKQHETNEEDIEQGITSTSNAPKHPLSEITLFGIGNSTTPVYLRLSERAENISSAEDLIACVQRMSGSREVSAQLFAGLCRSLGIPSRLVVSLQTPSWSVGASKIAATSGTTSNSNANSTLAKRKRQNAIEQRLRTMRKPEDVMTSDEESFNGGTMSEASAVEIKPSSSGRTTRAATRATRSDNSNNAGLPSWSQTPSKGMTRGAEKPDGQNVTQVSNGSSSKNKKGKDGDYRDEKWRNVDKPIAVKYTPKLRAQKPKGLKETELADAEVDADPVDISAPPTMWVEVFSKPWQKWVTVDPVRGTVEPLSNRQMEPSSSDRSNRLVYVLAFEEDGYARDVTARYTRTLHSRVARMRPPPAKKETDDWWSRVVAAVHRPQKLDRDAAEDVELDQASSREPMPSSVAAFKDHAVYALEKHLKRDEVIFPAKQAGTFQGTPVFLRSSVITCRSARQWYNEGRVVKDGEVALKWVKSRGYTLANKRAEEEARQQGFDGLQEGLYALFQTDIYRPPAVVDGQIPTNAFGNIDLFVDTMLPPGAVHIPYNGAGKVAKQLGVHYAEAIVGFEFRKHRSMPKLKGIVVAQEHGDAVMDAYWAAEHVNAERERKRKRDKQIKEWKKKLSAAQIRQRIRREYGHVDGVDLGSDDDDEHEFSDRDQQDESSDDEEISSINGDEEEEEKEEEKEEEEEEGEEEQGGTQKDESDDNLEGYRKAQRNEEGASDNDEGGGGGFIVDD